MWKCRPPALKKFNKVSLVRVGVDYALLNTAILGVAGGETLPENAASGSNFVVYEVGGGSFGGGNPLKGLRGAGMVRGVRAGVNRRPG